MTRRYAWQMPNWLCRSAVGLLFLLGLFAVSCRPTTKLRVTSTADGGSGSLRDAIDEANASQNSRAITIELADGTYELTECGSDDDNTAGDLDVLTNVPITLSAEGSNVIVRQNCAGERVLDDHGKGLLTLAGLTITGGRLVGTDPAVAAQGGGVRAVADVKLDSARFTGNSATGAPGVPVAGATAIDGGTAQGGGLYVGGALEATEAVFDTNTASGGSTASSTRRGGGAEGGGAYVALGVTLTAGSFNGNSIQSALGADVARGGGLAQASQSTAPINVAATAWSSNRAEGGAGTTGGSLLGTGNASGGALAVAGPLVMRNVTAHDNVAAGGFAPSNGNTGIGTGGFLYASSTVTLVDAVLSKNQAVGGAGSVFCGGYFGTLCSRTPSSGATGGAVWSGGDLTVQGGSFSQNAATAGPPRGAQTGHAAGGALASVGKISIERGEYAENVAGAVSTVLDLSVVSASVHGGPAGDALYAGGNTSIDGSKIDDNHDYAVHVGGALTLTNSELVGNGGGVITGSGDVRGVTIANNRGTGITAHQDLSLVNTTVSGNSGGAYGATLVLEYVTIADNGNTNAIQGSPVRVSHSVVIASKLVPICVFGTTIQSSSYTWFSDASCGLSGTGDHEGDAPFLLEPLADNGGPAQTRLPAAGSVLVNAIPSSACSLTMDERGVSRPQASGCDIGAVEAAPIANTGLADLSLAFVNPPASVVPGQDATWQLTLINRGPNGSAPSVVVHLPTGINLSSISATGGGSCWTTDSAAPTCVWNSALPSGSVATVSIKGHVDPAATASLTWQAEVFAPNLAPPLTDDRAELVIALTARAGIRMQAAFNGNYAQDAGQWLRVISVSLTNSGPSDAIGTADQPIQVLFHAAPGVHAKASAENAIVGKFPPGDQRFGTVSFLVSFDQSIPAELGTLELVPGVNPVPGIAPLHLIAADVQVGAHRTTITEPADASVAFGIDVTNQGLGVAQGVRIFLPGNISNYSTPAQGTLQVDPTYNQPLWIIPSLAVGQTLSVEGTSTNDKPASGSARVVSDSLDFDKTNDQVTIDATPATLGFADLEVTSLEQQPGPQDGELVLRVSVRNNGPLAAANLAVSISSLDVHTVVGAPADFACDPANLVPYCLTAQSLAAGASATFDFIVAKPASPLAPDSVAAQVSSSVPDALSSNNARYLRVPFG